MSLFAIILALSGCIGDAQTKNALPGDPGTVSVAYWNLYPLDLPDPPDDAVIESAAAVMTAYDIIVVSGLTDMSGESFSRICYLMPAHFCELSERRGELSKKERHGIIIRRGIELEDIRDFSYLKNRDFERPPISYDLSAEGIRFRITSLNSDPANAAHELNSLDLLTKRESIAKISEGITEELIVGTLNADCQSFSEDSQAFLAWEWTIPKGFSTLSSGRDCAMDQILANTQAKSRIGGFGVAKGINGAQHLPVYVVLSS